MGPLRLAVWKTRGEIARVSLGQQSGPPIVSIRCETMINYRMVFCGSSQSMTMNPSCGDAKRIVRGAATNGSINTSLTIWKGCCF